MCVQHFYMKSNNTSYKSWNMLMNNCHSTCQSSRPNY